MPGGYKQVNDEQNVSGGARGYTENAEG